MTRPVVLMRQWQADMYRKAPSPEERGPGYSDPAYAVASGRARCRCCGERIPKGERCIAVYHDFHGDNPWTSVLCYLALHQPR